MPTRFLDGPHAELAGIIANGALAVSGRIVTSGTFKSRQYSIPLDADEYPLDDFVRTFEIRWTGIGYGDGHDANQHSGENAKALRCTVLIGYRYDLDTPPTGAGTTAGDGALADAQMDALSDWQAIERALMWPANYSPTGNPRIFNIVPAGEATADDLGDGRVLLRAPLVVEVSFDPATAWGL